MENPPFSAEDVLWLIAAAVLVSVLRPADRGRWWAAAAAAKSGEAVGGMLTPDPDEELLLEDLPCRQVRLPSDLSAISSNCLGLMSV